MRVNVIGTSGSGKSSFAKQLTGALRIPYLEMDRLYWKPNWQEPKDEAFFSLLEQALSGDAWVLDGNYTRTTHIKWQRADLVIWIDYSLLLTVYRVIKRSILRAWTKQELWPGTGNCESFARLSPKTPWCCGRSQITPAIGTNLRNSWQAGITHTLSSFVCVLPKR